MTKTGSQTYVKFARQEEIVFDRWYRSLKLEKKYEELKEVVLLEQFKLSIHPSFKVHLEEHKSTKLKQAAISADDYELTHKRNFVKQGFQPNRLHKNWERNKPGSGSQLSTEKAGVEGEKKSSGSFRKDETRPSVICDHRKKPGHHKLGCWKLHPEAATAKTNK